MLCQNMTGQMTSQCLPNSPARAGITIPALQIGKPRLKEGTHLPKAVQAGNARAGVWALISQGLQGAEALCSLPGRIKRTRTCSLPALVGEGVSPADTTASQSG